MKVKQSSVPIFNVQLSELESTAALHALRSVVAGFQKRPSEVLTPYDKAALAFCKTFETLLVNQGAKNRLDEINEKYGKAPLSKQEKVSPLETVEEESYEEGLDSLIEEPA